MDNKNYTVKYEGELRVKMRHLKSGACIETDAPIDNNGKGEAFSPTDLLATSLVSCILTIVGIRLDNVKPISCDVRKVMISNPRRIGEIHIEFDFLTNDFSEKEMKVFKKIVETCPVTLSLHPEIKIITSL